MFWSLTFCLLWTIYFIDCNCNFSIMNKYIELNWKDLCCYVFVWIQIHLTHKAQRLRKHETGNSLYVLIIFDPILYIYIYKYIAEGIKKTLIYKHATSSFMLMQSSGIHLTILLWSKVKTKIRNTENSKTTHCIYLSWCYFTFTIKFLFSCLHLLINSEHLFNEISWYGNLNSFSFKQSVQKFCLGLP